MKWLANIEAEVIAAHDSVRNGYNTAERGRGAGPYGERFQAIIREAQNRPQTKAAMALVNARPEVSARRSAALKKSHNDPELRARLSATHTALGSGARIQTPEARRKATEAINRPEAIAAKSARMKAFHADPAGKAKHLAAVTIANNAPERLAKIVAARSGTEWMTDGETNKWLRAGQSLPAGWRLGRTLKLR